MQGIIYKTTNILNGKFYVGQTASKNVKYLGSGKLLLIAIKEHGRHNFSREIIEYCDIDKLDEREIFWISKLSPHYNIDGGGYNRSKDTGRAISLAKMGKPAWNKGLRGIYTKESLELMSKKAKERTAPNPFKGKKHSKETKYKISIKNKGRLAGNKNPMYGICRYGTKNYNYNHRWSEELKQKQSKYFTGKRTGINNPNYGKRGKDSKNYKHISIDLRNKIVYNYQTIQLTIKQISVIMNINRSKIRNILVEENIPRRQRMKRRVP